MNNIIEDNGDEYYERLEEIDAQIESLYEWQQEAIAEVYRKTEERLKVIMNKHREIIDDQYMGGIVVYDSSIDVDPFGN